jgi:thiamine kinase-like enzyme
VIRHDASVREEQRGTIDELLEQFAPPELASGYLVSFLAGGACNENYLIEVDGRRTFVLRLAELEVERFGFDRQKGADAHRSAATAGVAPELVAIRLPEGHSLVRYVDGPILDPQRIREPGMLARVGATLRRLHAGPRIEGTWSVFDDVRSYTRIARAESLRVPEDFELMLAGVARVESVFEEAAAPDAMCHNDLQLQNFIVEGDRLQMLDFEFAGRGNPYFDLGNVAVNAELSEAELPGLVEAYFGGADERDNARVWLMAFMAACREALWAVIAEPVLGIDWDYQAWAADYFRRCRDASDAAVFERALAAARG